MTEKVKDKKFLLGNFHMKNNKVDDSKSRERRVQCSNCSYPNYVKYTRTKFTCIHCKQEIDIEVLDFSKMQIKDKDGNVKGDMKNGVKNEESKPV